MNREILLLIIGTILVLAVNLNAQEPLPASLDVNEMGFYERQWTLIEHRWLRAQPVALAFTGPEAYLGGQLLHVNNVEMVLYPHKGVPVGPGWYSDVIRIPLGEVDRILLQKGGPGLLRARKASTIVLPASMPYVYDDFMKLKRASIYRDSLAGFGELEAAFRNSHLMRRVFPDKFVRLTFGFSVGPDVITKDVEEMISNSALPPADYGWNTRVSAELFDISVRLFDCINLGGQLVAQRTRSNLSANWSGAATYIYFGYGVDLHQNSLYMEYAFLNVDRFFTRRFEPLIGGGLLLSSSGFNLFYNYENFEDMENISGDYAERNWTEKFQGFQLRGSIHAYLFPGLSLFSGVEANLYPAKTVSSVELPSPIIGETIMMPEYPLNFSSVRFRLGVSIYL